jgi:hypothetical protein
MDYAEAIIDAVGYKPSLAAVHEFRAKSEQMIAVASRGAIKPSANAVTLSKHVLECTTQALLWSKASRSAGSQMPVVVINGLNSIFQRDHPDFSMLLMDWIDLLISHNIASVVSALENSMSFVWTYLGFLSFVATSTCFGVCCSSTISACREAVPLNH